MPVKGVVLNDKAYCMSRQDASAAKQVAGRILTLQRTDESDADFARRLGVSPQLLNHYKQGGGASVSALAKIIERGHDAVWLVTGRGGRGATGALSVSELEEIEEGLREMEAKVRELRERFGSTAESEPWEARPTGAPPTPLRAPPEPEGGHTQGEGSGVA